MNNNKTNDEPNDGFTSTPCNVISFSDTGKKDDKGRSLLSPSLGYNSENPLNVAVIGPVIQANPSWVLKMTSGRHMVLVVIDTEDWVMVGESFNPKSSNNPVITYQHLDKPQLQAIYFGEFSKQNMPVEKLIMHWILQKEGTTYIWDPQMELDPDDKPSGHCLKG